MNLAAFEAFVKIPIEAIIDWVQDTASNITDFVTAVLEAPAKIFEIITEKKLVATRKVEPETSWVKS